MGTSVIPNLMPYQMDPFNGDIYLQEEFLSLKEQFGIINVIESGTCLGSTTIWLADNFDFVTTIEINTEFLNIAKKRFTKHINIFNEDSVSWFKRQKLPENTLCFLDAHWEKNCPLMGELEAIAEGGTQPVIAIHDFLVPGRPDLGYDSYNNQKFELSWIYPVIERIYKNTGLSIKYNDKATGAMRGCVFITPLNGYI